MATLRPSSQALRSARVAARGTAPQGFGRELPVGVPVIGKLLKYEQRLNQVVEPQKHCRFRHTTCPVSVPYAFFGLLWVRGFRAEEYQPRRTLFADRIVLFRHSGAPHSGEPGIHNPDCGWMAAPVHYINSCGYGFRALSCARPRNDG